VKLMTIEVRQMVVKTLVEDERTPSDTSGPGHDGLLRVKEEILAECKAWLEEWTREQTER